MFLFKLTTNFEYRRENQLIKHSLPRPVLPFLLSPSFLIPSFPHRRGSQGSQQSSNKMHSLQMQQYQERRAQWAPSHRRHFHCGKPLRRHMRASGRALKRRNVFHAAGCKSPKITSPFCKANKSVQFEGLLKRARVKPCSEGHTSRSSHPPPFGDSESAEGAHGGLCRAGAKMLLSRTRDPSARCPLCLPHSHPIISPSLV